MSGMGKSKKKIPLKSETLRINKKNRKSGKTGKNKKEQVLNLRALVILWGAVFALLVVVFVAVQFLPEGFVNSATFPLVGAVTAFAAFAVQALFSFTIIKYNAVNREFNEELKLQNTAADARAEQLSTLQFISANYTVVDFVDYMLIYAEPERYVNIVKKAKDFSLYMREYNIDESDVTENFSDYKFVTVKIPIAIIEGKSINKIRFSRFKFTKEDGDHRFVPCGTFTDSLILYSETDKRQEIVVNLVMRKSSEFFKAGAVIPFLKIKIGLSMCSLLGVEVKGNIELYFTNPEKLEASGANKYRIISSHFEVSGFPRLLNLPDEEL